MKNTLILYGTRYGSTKEISERIAETLKEKDFEVKVVNLAEEKTPAFKGYDGVLVGTGIKMGMWTKRIKKFVNRNLDELNKRDFKLGLFISCGTASKKEKVQEAIDDFLLKKTKKIGLHLDIYDAFGGIYDLSDNSPVGKVGRAALKAGLKEEEGWETVENKLYDFRDWDQINKFAQDFASLL